MKLPLMLTTMAVGIGHRSRYGFAAAFVHGGECSSFRSASGETRRQASSFVREFVDRGYFHQCTDLEYLEKKTDDDLGTPMSAYLGFDATAPSLHVGSLLQIMILRLLQRCGHKPVILVGGGTTRIGDPSGKDESRKMLDDATIEENVAGITSIFGKFVTFGDGPTDAVLVNNADWLGDLNYVDFLRDYGPHFSVNRMLSFDSVKTRLERESPLSFLEFNYMILQAYDFLELSRRKDVVLQLGGSDQWGNIVSGVELGRRIDSKKLVGLTAPLIATSDGRKMGKTADGAVWLTPDKLSPYDYWQFWRNVDDADVIRFLKLFTDIPVAEINEINVEGAANVNAAKRRLADETTSLLHGPESLPSIHEAVDAMFSGGGAAANSRASAALPTFDVSDDLKDGQHPTVVDLLVKVEFVKSKAEAKRLIAGGGARVNDVKVADPTSTISLSDFDDEDILKISAGKKKHAILTLARA